MALQKQPTIGEVLNLHAQGPQAKPTRVVVKSVQPNGDFGFKVLDDKGKEIGEVERIGNSWSQFTNTVKSAPALPGVPLQVDQATLPAGVLANLAAVAAKKVSATA